MRINIEYTAIHGTVNSIRKIVNTMTTQAIAFDTYRAQSDAYSIGALASQIGSGPDMSALLQFVHEHPAEAS